MYKDLKVGISLECSSSREKASVAIVLNRGRGRRGCDGQFYGTLSTWPGYSPQLTQSNTNLGLLWRYSVDITKVHYWVSLSKGDHLRYFRWTQLSWKAFRAELRLLWRRRNSICGQQLQLVLGVPACPTDFGSAQPVPWLCNPFLAINLVIYISCLLLLLLWETLTSTDRIFKKSRDRSQTVMGDEGHGKKFGF